MDNKKILGLVGGFCILAGLFSLVVSLWKGDGFSSIGLAAAAVGMILMVLSGASKEKK